MAKTVNLTWWQGQTYRWGFVWAAPGATPDAPPVPRDVTGCTARMQVREKYDAPVLVDLTTENGGLILGGVDGRIEIYASDAQTDTLGAKALGKPRELAAYDLELVYASGDVRRVIQGAIAIRPNITREVPA